MKSIRDFLDGKIRRTESEEVLRLEEGAVHAAFGACEGVLVGPRGRAAFHEHGLVLEGGIELAYADIARVELSPATEGARLVDVVLASGATARLASSALGGEVVHATLRWIGNTRLKRKIAD